MLPDSDVSSWIALNICNPKRELMRQSSGRCAARDKKFELASIPRKNHDF